MNDFSKLIDDSDPVGSVFAPLIGLPVWNVQKGQGSFLTFDFGAPHLSITEPITDPRTENPKIRDLLRRRVVRPHGEFYLWIYCCHWRCTSNGAEVAHDQSADAEIITAARFMDGQILLSVDVYTASGKSLFRFDLGATLETWPYESGNEEQWTLDTPSKHVFCYRADGHYSWGPADRLTDEDIWIALPARQHDP